MTRSKVRRPSIRLYTLISLTAALVGVCLAISGVALAGGGNSHNAKVCQKGGWASANLQTDSGESISFDSQDDCVEYGATVGLVFNPSLRGDPAHVVENQESFFVASGFHPLSQGTLTIHTLGGPDGTSTLVAKTTETGGLPSNVGTVFLPGACALGEFGAEITLVDGSGVHASGTIFLDCL